MPRPPFIIGADLSLLKQLMDHGAKYEFNGRQDEPAKLLASAGLNCARLRLFHTPCMTGAQINDLKYTIELARMLKQAGMSILLCMHFSDGWADPGKQVTPRAWGGMDFGQLERAVFDYTRDVIAAMASQGAAPDMVQVGNEITPGMLWEAGRIDVEHEQNSLHWNLNPGADSEESWLRLGRLLKAGIDGIKAADAGGNTEIMLHIDRGGDWDTCRWFFDHIEGEGIEYDAIGLSYYSFWHGTVDDLSRTLANASKTYDKDVYVVETAHPHKMDALYDSALRDFPDLWREITSRYPLTPDGQKRFIEAVLQAAQQIPGDRARGVFYWAPEWIPCMANDEPDAAPCWARALFDAEGRALPALEAIQEFSQRLLEPQATR